ncbi:MAG: EamA family transporter [Clostridia bacterium]|nr:EamA family transporter [Clostridia bacterium]
MRNKTLPTVFILLAAALWGCMGLFVRYFNGIGIEAMDIALLRVLTASVFLPMAIGLYQPTAFKIKTRHLWCFLGTGILSLSMFTFCYFKTIEMTDLSIAAVLLYTAPVMVVLMSAVFFKEKLTWMKGLACLLAFIGCVLVSDLQGSSLPPLALLTGLLSGLGYALYSIFSRFAMNRGYRSLTIVVYTFWFSLLGILPFSHPIATFEKIAAAGWIGWLMLVGMGILTAVLPYLFYTLGLEKTEAGKASVMASLEPVVATVAGLIAFGEVPSLWAAGGIILVLLGVVLLNVRFKKL